MSELAIRTNNISKQYFINKGAGRNKTLRDSISNLFRDPLQSKKRILKKDFWALKDITFDVKNGEILGIIGKNGAGKSTLLKVLSRITEPTTGKAEIYGRVGSLLEVGTGFHSELTGRENIYLNGAIIGMQKSEIKKKFDEIVDFAEIEDFLDTPVKHYSSGMFVRLAFAVAAHLESEILIIDEVLAVGDAEFQKKCLGKMGDVTRDGRTVLFVSHNMVAVQSLCSRILWIDKGNIVLESKPEEVVSKYLQSSFTSVNEQLWPKMETAPGNDIFRLHGASIRNENSSTTDPIKIDKPIVVEFFCWNLKPDAYLNLYYQIYNEQDVVVFETGPTQEPVWKPIPAGLFQDICYIPAHLLNDGMYRIVLQVVNYQGVLIHQEDDILIFTIHDTADLRDGWYGRWAGTVRPALTWERKIIKQGLE